MANATRTKTKTIVADICLYGNHPCGAGYIASLPDGRMFGDGEPSLRRSMTDAIWLAVLDIRDAGATQGMVRVFAPGGGRMAMMDVNRPVYFGELAWESAPVYEISVEDLMAAAESV